MKTSVTDNRLGWGISELAARTGTSIGLWRKEIKAGRLPAMKIGRRVVVLDEDLRQYLRKAPACRKVHRISTGVTAGVSAAGAP
jgi:excisionase family DNA binding protein